MAVAAAAADVIAAIGVMFAIQAYVVANGSTVVAVVAAGADDIASAHVTVVAVDAFVGTDTACDTSVFAGVSYCCYCFFCGFYYICY